MAADARPEVNPPPPAAPPRPAAKVRLRFAKSGRLRLLSHHDLLRTFERMLRRARLPFYSTHGFNPRPRLVFALSLPLGVVGREEVVELELGEAVAPEEVRGRLAATAPPGLEVLSARAIEPKVTAQVRRLCYGVAVPAERGDEVRARAAEVLASAECWVERTRPPRRRLDLRPFLCGLTLTPAAQGLFLEMALALTPAGTARPEEVLGLLGLQDLVEAGAVLERTRLELEDEAPPPPPGEVP